jgi:hypothetical protein
MTKDTAEWSVFTILEKFRDGEDEPYAVFFDDGNMLVYGGSSALLHRLTGGTSVNAFSNANAHIGVGDGTHATAATQTDLQGANKDRQPMEATFPLHTDGTNDAAASVTFQSEWGPGEASFAWNEWGIFNASSSGRMLNRKLRSYGTKGAGDTWKLTVTITLS